MDDFWKVMDEYRDMFGDYLPLYELQGLTEEETVALAKKCMNDRKPYSGSEYKAGINY